MRILRDYWERILYNCRDLIRNNHGKFVSFFPSNQFQNIPDSYRDKALMEFIKDKEREYAIKIMQNRQRVEMVLSRQI